MNDRKGNRANFGKVLSLNFFSLESNTLGRHTRLASDVTLILSVSKHSFFFVVATDARARARVTDLDHR